MLSLYFVEIALVQLHLGKGNCSVPYTKPQFRHMTLLVKVQFGFISQKSPIIE